MWSWPLRTEIGPLENRGGKSDLFNIFSFVRIGEWEMSPISQDFHLLFFCSLCFQWMGTWEVLRYHRPRVLDCIPGKDDGCCRPSGNPGSLFGSCLSWCQSDRRGTWLDRWAWGNALYLPLGTSCLNRLPMHPAEEMGSARRARATAGERESKERRLHKGSGGCDPGSRYKFLSVTPETYMKLATP